MHNLESNKIFAAILVAGIVAMLAGFVANKLIHPHELETDAVPLEGTVVADSGGPAAPTGPEPILHLIAAADIAAGEKLSKACAACHSFDQGGPNKVGPNLWNVVGANHAHIEGFAYSEALLGMKDMKWGYPELNHFLWKPKHAIAGTKMNFVGLKKPEDRASLIAWLRTLSAAPVALPTQAEIDAEAPKPTDEVEGGPEPVQEPGQEQGAADPQAAPEAATASQTEQKPAPAETPAHSAAP
jgi:cytochrome c